MAIPQTTTISAVQARKQFGRLLDKTFYRGESFVVERSGEPRAVIVPLQEYNEMKRRQNDAKNRLFEMIDKTRERNKNVDPKEIQTAIDTAVEDVRKESSSQ